MGEVTLVKGVLHCSRCMVVVVLPGRKKSASTRDIDITMVAEMAIKITFSVGDCLDDSEPH